MTKKTNFSNPKDYYYKPEVNVEIPGGFLLELLHLSEQLMADEVKMESKFKYKFINESDKAIKNPKQEDLESGKVKKIVDWEKTIENPSFDYSLTEKGVAYAKLKKFLESIHMQAIASGLATNYVEEQAELKKVD